MKKKKKKGEKTSRAALLQPPSPPYAQVLATVLLFCTAFHLIGTSGDLHPSQEADICLLHIYHRVVAVGIETVV